MGVEYKSYKLEKFFHLVNTKKIVLPNFQRGYIWTVDQQRNLIASLLVNLPIGSTLHIEGNKGDFTARAICEQKEIEPEEECEYLLDGQQRISTLYNALRDIFNNSQNWEEINNKLFKNLKYRWFIKIDINQDIFGYKNLKFIEDLLLEKEPREVKDIILHKQILKKDKDKWFHPAYKPKDVNGRYLTEERARLHISKLAAQEKLIPLYEIYKKSDGLHRKVLKELAKERIDEIKAEIKDDVISITEILGHLDPDVESLPEEDKNALFTELQVTWAEEVSRFLERFLEKEIPIILLHKHEIGRAAAIFEEINKGGTPLSNFDLIVAKAARATERQLGKSLVKVILELLDSEFNVSHIDNELEDGSWKASYFTSIEENLPSKRFQGLYLNLLSLLAYESKEGKEISKLLISRNSILSLKPEYVVEFTEPVTVALSRAFAFLQLKCGHINESQISYDYMVLPIAYLLNDDNVWQDETKLKKLEAWFWASLFAGSYKERQDDQFVSDLKALKAWIIDENLVSEDLDKWKEGDTVTLKVLKNSLFRKEDYSDITTLLNKNPNTTAPSAIKNSILQYILSKKPHDLLPDNPDRLSAFKASLENPKLEIHHIIPLGSATNIGESTKKLRKDKKHILNSPLNLTYISDKANSNIRDKRVNEYFQELPHFDLRTHFIPSIDGRLETNEEFENFLRRRFELIEGSVIGHINNLLS